MSRVDRWLEQSARTLARRSSRRSFLARLGGFLVGAASLPLLPVARGQVVSGVENPSDCSYWRYCAIDGFLCSCCGGSESACPPGTEMSPITWIGTCRNPADDKQYLVSYNDCCGASLCMRCRCTRTENERPVYLTGRNNDLLWCFGTKSRAVNCSVSIVLGPAT